VTPGLETATVGADVAPPAGRAYLPVLIACAVMALLPIWVPRYLPSTDLPQHAAQIAIWARYDDPATHYRQLYSLHYFTPYLIGYVIARLLADVVPVLVALKVVLSLAVVGTALAMHRLLREAGHDVWWSLSGFPLGLGFAFRFGFLNFLVAIPLSILYLALVVRHCRQPRPRDGLVIAMASGGLFMAHALIFVAFVPAAALTVMIRAGRGTSGGAWVVAALRDGLPFLGGVALAMLWVLASGQTAAHAAIPDVGEWGWRRFVVVGALLCGYGSDPASSLFGWGLVGLLLLGGLQRRSERAFWLPLAAWAAIYLLVPRTFRNVAQLYTRMAVLGWPCLFVCFAPARPRLDRRLLRAGVVVLVVTSSALTLARFRAFDADARHLDSLLASMQPQRRLRSLMFERGSGYLGGGAPFLHHGLWYDVERAGSSAFSFAGAAGITVVRSRTLESDAMDPLADWRPERFDAAREARRADYFLVRGVETAGEQLFAASPDPVVPLMRSGRFALFERRPGNPR
jgi:MYXO-CTERM domain-containing protein